MAEKPQAETMIVINGRLGRIILRDKRVLMPGGSAKVSLQEGKELLKTPGVKDAANVVPEQAAEKADLEKQIEALKAENAALKKAAPAKPADKKPAGDKKPDAPKQPAAPDAPKADAKK